MILRTHPTIDLNIQDPCLGPKLRWSHSVHSALDGYAI